MSGSFFFGGGGWIKWSTSKLTVERLTHYIQETRTDDKDKEKVHVDK